MNMKRDDQLAHLTAKFAAALQKDILPCADNLGVLGVRVVMVVYFLPSPPTMRELSRTLQILTASATLVVDRLVSEGYLLRTRDVADRRVVRVSLTSMAISFIESHLERRTATIKKALCNFEESQKDTIITFLQILTDEFYAKASSKLELPTESPT